MLRYIILVWNSADQAQRNTAGLLARHWKSGATGWCEGFASDGLCVLYTGDCDGRTEAHRLQDRRGIILGTLFSRANETCESEIKPVEETLQRSSSARILGSEGRELIDSYWGSYVAILHDAPASRSWIIRSPVGSLPCFATLYQGVRIYFSSIRDCASYALLAFTVNWNYVARYLGKLGQSRDTGLNEVSEVQYGECVAIDHSNNSERILQYWNALDVARTESIQDPAEATIAVRKTLRMCVQAWACCYPTIMLRLSGGLDSSIVLSCLHDAPSRPHVICVNRYSPRADSDERAFAQLAAQHAGCELLEMRREPECKLEDILCAYLAERPQNYLTQFSQGVPEMRLARTRDVSAIFCGTYGDQLFSVADSGFIAADHIYDFGIRPSLLPVIHSAARAGGFSIWKIIQKSILKGLFPYRWDPVGAARSMSELVNADVLRELTVSGSDTYPWYQRDRYVPPGKQFQLFGLMQTESCYRPFAEADNLRHISPLLSQPLVELCLRIPTYVLSFNGWDREIARRAFAPDIPARIARRRTKGGQADFTSQIAKKNQSFIRELLMNGGLVSSGLLDRTKLEAALAGRSPGLERGPARVSKVLNIEVWLKAWSNRQLRIAA